MSDSIRTQVHRNLVAIISLVVALSSLGYNTWRNERTEYNRNIRAAGFELLVKLSELQQVVFFSHYERDQVRGSPRAGWVYVLTIDDLAQLTPPPLPKQASALVTTWGDHWEGLGTEPDAERAITAAIDLTRNEVLATLQRLD